MIKKIMIMAGGTGGHIFPGIAIGKAIQDKNPDCEILWLGSLYNMETKIIPEQTSFKLLLLNISGFRKKSFFKKCILPFYLLTSLFQAIKILKKEKPDAVLGMGGFVCGPGAIAAKCLRIPIYIHEQNSIPGLTNKILSKIAAKVFCGFPDAFKQEASSSNTKFIFTGNPVRNDILNLPPKTQLHKPIRLLIVGGSRGAQVLNEILPLAIEQIPKKFQCEILHQTGDQSQANYSSNMENISINKMTFITDMAKKYEWADIIICRAGALTLAEITAIGLPAILVPYPHAVDDHQTKNAEFLAKHQAAYLLKQSDLTPEKISRLITTLFDEKTYLEMSKASRALRCEKAIAKILENLEWKSEPRA